MVVNCKLENEISVMGAKDDSTSRSHNHPLLVACLLGVIPDHA